MTRVELGRHIRAVREAKGLSQRDLGALLVPPRTHAAVSDIERSKTGLDIEGMTMVAGALGVGLGDLLACHVPPEPEGLAVVLVRRVDELERQMRKVRDRLGPWA